MIRKSLFLILILSSVFILLLSYLYFNNKDYNNNDNDLLIKNDELKKILGNIGNDKVIDIKVTEKQIWNTNNKICDNFDKKLTNDDLKKQERAVKSIE